MYMAHEVYSVRELIQNGMGHSMLELYIEYKVCTKCGGVHTAHTVKFIWRRHAHSCERVDSAIGVHKHKAMLHGRYTNMRNVYRVMCSLHVRYSQSCVHRDRI